MLKKFLETQKEQIVDLKPLVYTETAQTSAFTPLASKRFSSQSKHKSQSSFKSVGMSASQRLFPHASTH